MEIDSNQVVKILLLSILLDNAGREATPEGGRTLKNIVDIFEKIGIQDPNALTVVGHRELLEKELGELLSQYKDQGLLFIRSVNLPVPRYLLSWQGENFLLDNLFVQIILKNVSIMWVARNIREEVK